MKVSMASESVSHDSRKRTLEALERRFAVAKAELHLQQKKSKINEDGKQPTNTGPASADLSVNLSNPSEAPPQRSFSKKGNSTSVLVFCCI